jgi:hypothetical protein
MRSLPKTLRVFGVYGVGGISPGKVRRQLFDPHGLVAILEVEPA